MSFQVCHTHGKVTAWGCPICRREAIKLDLAKAVEETREKIREAFRHHPAKPGEERGG